MSFSLSPIAPNSVVKEFDGSRVMIKGSASDVTEAAVTTVLSAYKGRLSAKDFEQLQLIMSKDTHHLEKEKEREEEIEKISDSIFETNRITTGIERNGNENEKGKEGMRLSFEGGSWTSRESFLPPSPKDRFILPSNPTISNSSLTSQESVLKIIDNRANTIQNQNNRNNQSSNDDDDDDNNNSRGNTNYVRFNVPGAVTVGKDRIETDRERERDRSSILPNGGNSSHIRYGPVTFMRRPMTPFAPRSSVPTATPTPTPIPSSSPFYRANMSYDGTSSSVQGYGVGKNQIINFNILDKNPSYQQQQLQSNLPFQSTEEIQRKRRYEESKYTDM